MDRVDQVASEGSEPGEFARAVLEGAANEPAVTFAQLSVELYDSDGVEEGLPLLSQLVADLSVRRHKRS